MPLSEPGEGAGRGRQTRFSGLRQAVRVCAAALTQGAAACTPLAAFNAVIPKDGGTVRVVRGASFGADARLRIDLYAPARRGAGTLPVILWIYGGSWNSGERGGYGFVGRALAARGFLVAIPDYRLVPSVRFPSFLQDNAAAFRWLRAHAAAHGGDPERIVLAGHSAGAYNAAMLALDPRWLGRDRAAVRGLVALAGPFDFAPFEGEVTRATFGAWPDPADTQPISFVSADDPPTLLLAGAKDAVVDPGNSTRLTRRLAAAGVPAEERIYPGVTHVGLLTAIARPFRRRAPVLDDMARFAAKVTATPAAAAANPHAPAPVRAGTG